MIRIGIAEDIPRLAQMLKAKLSHSENLSVVWWTRNGQETIAALNRGDMVDVILMDIGMPKMNGIDATAYISRNWPDIKIIMNTVFDDDDNLFNAILAGACGYLLKDESPQSIISAIDQALGSGAPMSPGIARKALMLIKSGGSQDKNNTSDFGITDREKDVLEQLSRGQTYNQMAESLCISIGTVRTHIENIYRKLQVHNKVEAVQKAKDNRIV